MANGIQLGLCTETVQQSGLAITELLFFTMEFHAGVWETTLTLRAKWACFTKNFPLKILTLHQIMIFIVQMLWSWSPQNLAHAPTALLSVHVQNVMVNSNLHLNLHKNSYFTKFVCPLWDNQAKAGIPLMSISGIQKHKRPITLALWEDILYEPGQSQATHSCWCSVSFHSQIPGPDHQYSWWYI